jgi:regulatory protein
VQVDPAAQVDDTIAWLRAHQYLSDTRFAESRVHARAARYGNLRIRQELAQHGVALDAAAAQALKDSELDRAREVWRRKFGEPAADAGGRAKQARFLAQRGFSPELISRLLRTLGRAVVDDDETG